MQLTFNANLTALQSKMKKLAFLFSVTGAWLAMFAFIKASGLPSKLELVSAGISFLITALCGAYACVSADSQDLVVSTKKVAVFSTIGLFIAIGFGDFVRVYPLGAFLVWILGSFALATIFWGGLFFFSKRNSTGT